MKTPHIVFIHGLASSGKIFNHLRSQLPQHKSTVIEYDSSVGFNKIFEGIEEVLPKKKSISIIGHSLGGIFGHLLVTRCPDIKAENLISISTPFGGSEIAGKLKWFYPGYRMLKDVATNSPIIKEISQSPVENCNFLSIISTHGHLPFMMEQNDGVVTVKSQKQSLAHKFVEIDANHFEIVQDPTAITSIKDFLFI